jgi:hypothetical protein
MALDAVSIQERLDVLGVAHQIREPISGLSDWIGLVTTSETE